VRRLFGVRGVLGVVIVAAAARPALAQTGTLRGVVTSASHAPVAGACVMLGGSTCTGVADARGAYVIHGVPAGTAVVTVTAVGSQPRTDTITVAAGATTTHDVTLAAGPLLLSSIVVTATRRPTEARNVANTVDVMTSQQVRASPTRDAQDLLREIPAVELPRTSSMVGGSAQIVSIRGVDEGRTAVLVDGMPINDAWGEWIDWGRLPKDAIDHVEVVEGGASNLYGNGAIGGVISFFTRPLPPLSSVVAVDGGSRDARHAYAAGGLPLAGPFSLNLSGDYLDGGGYTMLDPAKRGAVDVPSELTQRNAMARLVYAPAHGRWSGFVAGHVFDDARDLGTPLSYGHRAEHVLELGATGRAVVGGELTLRGWDGHLSEFQRATTVRANSTTCASPSSAARQCEDSSSVAGIPSDDRGVSAVWTRNGLFGLSSFTAGADYRYMAGHYDETDFSTSCPGATCGSVTRTISSGGDQALSGAFAQAILAPADPLRVELSLRVDRWDNDDGYSIDTLAGHTTYPNRSKSALSPRVGVRYQLLRSLAAHAAYYHAFRAPNLAELYRKQINGNASQITIPNPDLKPETGAGYEAGLDFQPAPGVQLAGTAYLANYDDFNVPVVIAAGPPAIRQRLNVSHSRSKGAELSLALRPWRPLLVSAGASYDDDRVVSSDSTNGQHINRVPSPRYTVRAAYTSPLLGEYTLMWRYEGKTTTLQGLPLAPFAVVDADARREVTDGVTAFVSLENIGNEQYQVNIAGSGANELISYGLPRTLRAGLTWSR